MTTFKEPWKLKHDPSDEGTAARWFDPALDDSQWPSIRTDQLMGWDMQGFPGGRGFRWYRSTLPANKRELTGTFNYLYFDAIDEEAWVYLNGQQVFEHTAASTNLLPEELWITPFVISLAGVELHGHDPLAVRVSSKEAMAGIYKSVHLIRSAHSLTDEQLHAVRKLEARE